MLLCDLRRRHASRPPNSTRRMRMTAILSRMRRVGIEPGKPLATPEVERALTEGSAAALKEIKARFRHVGVANAGWRTNLTAIGT
jgi:hypothetical protein